MAIKRLKGLRCGLIVAAFFGLCDGVTLQSTQAAESDDVSGTAAKKDGLPSFGVFPVGWLDGVDEVYPISSAPEDVKWEAWLAVKAAARGTFTHPVIIEVFNGSESAGVKIKKYLVEHHKFSARRFEIKLSQSPQWNGYAVVRTFDEKLPPAPIRPPQVRYQSPISLRAPEPANEYIQAKREPVLVQRQVLSSNLLSPWVTQEFLEEAPDPVNEEVIQVSQAAPMNSSEARVGWLGSTGPQLRPYAAMEWFGVEEAKTPVATSKRARAGWMGARLQGEAALLRWSIGEVGVGGSVYRSIFAITPDSRTGKATDVKALTHFLLRANSTLMGRPMLKITAGYHANWRNLDRAVNLHSTVGGLRTGAEVSTFVDRIFTLGANTAYTFSQAGVFEVGGFISHRIINTPQRSWDARVGVMAASARETVGATRLDENWTSVQFGVIGAL
jgi:hypothetical protein